MHSENIQESVRVKLKSFRIHIRKILTWIRLNRLRSIIYFSLGLATSVLCLILFIWIGVFGKLPNSRQLKEIKNPVASIIYGSNQEIIGHYFIQNRSNIDSSEINEHVKNALLATEDIRFYTHGGIDYRSLGRVLVKNLILQNRRSGGGSTITQQLAKNVFGRKKRFFLSTPINKIREIFIAYRLEKVYTKDEIMLLYLNTVSFGESIYGLEKAAKRFFNKKPASLNLLESATLIGVLKATNYYSPRLHPERAQKRRNVVLSQMFKYHFLDSLTTTASMATPLKLNYQVSKYKASFAAFYKEFLEKEFNTWARKHPRDDGSLYDLHKDGLKIFTTLHPSIQRSAERAVAIHMNTLQKSFDKGWDVQSPKNITAEEFVSQLALNLPSSKALARKGISMDSILTRCQVKKERQMRTLDGYQVLKLSVIDSIIMELTTLQTAMLGIHSTTGKILAYVGGVNFGYSQFDNVQIPRQVGSTFKPITYLTALESGEEPCDFYDNQLITYEQYEGWTPRNADGKYDGSYSLYGALSHSINTVSVQIMLKTGISQVIEMARKMGIRSSLPNVPSLVLGTADISLFDLVTAYSSISNGGFQVAPYTINRIEDEDGNIIYRGNNSISSAPIASSENIEALQRMMEQVTVNGTASRFANYEIPYNIIGKTGTTQNNSDGWFVGCTPEIVIGSWVGTLDRRIHFKSTSQGSGANTALPMVARVFKNLSLWKTSMISNFNYSVSGFPCLDYSEYPADEASEMIWMEVDSLSSQDSLLPIPQQLDSLSTDSLRVGVSNN